MLRKKQPLWFAAIFLAIVILTIFSACAAEPVLYERSDLVIINSGFQGYRYAILLENGETLLPLVKNVQVKFDAGLDKPKLVLSRTFNNNYDTITIYFRDRDQMLSYWLAR
ncbi:MAG: hypothetical protein HYV47_01890 [Candidatus Nealsonbacteria bacterium]|nr:hypothetical protein [Candidatus Nealsonbacteria bacterium]